MLWVFVGLLGAIAFVFLTRLFWETAYSPERSNESRRPLVTLAIGVLVFALLMLIASGKMHWLSGLFAGIAPFLRRLAGLLRYAPLLQNLFGRVPGRTTPPPTRAEPALTLETARAMLEVGENATAEEIVAAHRRLIARNHPDRGGSTYIAAQLNSAKELLLQQLS